ncbi:hypothetical protein [Nitrosococcus halophilus]|uniref:hypothetical protein n=1 Tax=Nitrosococcus halophilus TaxID=133539 RepID=UPI0012FE8904|nr:hypothetical protein [Nitrosococcus halophilus]
MDASLAAVFLYSRAVKLPLLPLMIYYFGTAYTLVLCLYLLGFSIMSGVLMRKLEDREMS